MYKSETNITTTMELTTMSGQIIVDRTIVKRTT